MVDVVVIDVDLIVVLNGLNVVVAAVLSDGDVDDNAVLPDPVPLPEPLLPLPFPLPTPSVPATSVKAIAVTTKREITRSWILRDGRQLPADGRGYSRLLSLTTLRSRQVEYCFSTVDTPVGKAWLFVACCDGDGGIQPCRGHMPQRRSSTPYSK